MNRFLIAFDGGQSSLKAVHHVATQPLLKGMDCHIVAVGKPGSPLAKELEDAALGLRGAGYTVTAELLTGEPEAVIARHVTDQNIDLLVMGAYGHSPIRQFILGSTTTSLIRTCLVPLLLFR